MEHGSRVRRERIARGWTQAELAEVAGVSQSYVSRVEGGQAGSPAGVVRLLEVLGVDAESRPERPQPKSEVVLDAYPIHLRPASLSVDLELETHVHPAHGGDFFVFVSLGPQEVLVAAVDVAGNGPSALPAARYLQGWIRGRANATRAPRLDALAGDLLRELELTGIEAAWYLALLRTPHDTALHYEAVADSYPAPLLFVDEEGTTHPSLASSSSPRPIFAPISVVLRPPCTLALASDGMLSRLGAGDELSGKRTIRRWLNGERRRRPIVEQFGVREEVSVDESLAVLRWSPWTERYVFDIADCTERHRTQRSIRNNARTVIGARADDLGRALAEALNNVLSHAYGGGGGRVEVTYREWGTRVELEVRDEGRGAFGEGDGVNVIRRSCAAQRFRGAGGGHIVYLRCDAEESE